MSSGYYWEEFRACSFERRTSPFPKLHWTRGNETSSGKIHMTSNVSWCGQIKKSVAHLSWYQGERQIVETTRKSRKRLVDASGEVTTDWVQPYRERTKTEPLCIVISAGKALRKIVELRLYRWHAEIADDRSRLLELVGEIGSVSSTEL